MAELHEPIARLFPVGGPVPRDLIVGRRGDIDELTRRMREGMSTMLAAPRRIGKTTVCSAVCEDLKEEGTLVVEVDVPERPDSRTLLQLIVNACSRISLEEHGRRAFAVARPLIEKLLADQGIPLDLSALGPSSSDVPARAVLSLPAELAKHRHKRALLSSTSCSASSTTRMARGFCATWSTSTAPRIMPSCSLTEATSGLSTACSDLPSTSGNSWIDWGSISRSR
jgi:hypothetical protein